MSVSGSVVVVVSGTVVVVGGSVVVVVSVTVVVVVVEISAASLLDEQDVASNAETAKSAAN
jgi:hypothetical protein